MRIFTMIDRWMLRRFPRYRLRRICKAIGIKPYKWQRDFALYEIGYIPKEAKKQRESGKTTAMFLRILMITNNNVFAWARAGAILEYDPDWREDRLRWYSGEYRRLRDLCLAAGIPVLRCEIYRMIEKNKEDIWKNA